MSAKAFVQIINNPAKPRTSRRSADELVSRGALRWVTFPFTAQLVPVEERLAAQEDRMLARARGGSRLSVKWGVGKVRATENQPEWMPRELGFSVLGAIVCPIYEPAE